MFVAPSIFSVQARVQILELLPSNHLYSLLRHRRFRYFHLRLPALMKKFSSLDFTAKQVHKVIGEPIRRIAGPAKVR
jgi:hypothetical protein